MAKGMPYLMLPPDQYYVVIGFLPDGRPPSEVMLFDNEELAQSQREAFWRMGLNTDTHCVEVQRA